MRALILLALLISCGGDEGSNHHSDKSNERITAEINSNPSGVYFIQRRGNYRTRIEYRFRGDTYVRDLQEFRYRAVPGGWMVRSRYNLTRVIYL